MNIKEIRELIQLIEESAIEEFEMERSGVRIRVRKTISSGSLPQRSRASSASSSSTAMELEEEKEEEEKHYIFKAPIVGTFYITPKPDAEPFVRAGERVSKGTVLCVIEAMKIFNQIESDVDGELVKILCENGQPVEYGQSLFEIRLTG